MMHINPVILLMISTVRALKLDSQNTDLQDVAEIRYTAGTPSPKPDTMLQQDLSYTYSLTEHAIGTCAAVTVRWQ